MTPFGPLGTEAMVSLENPANSAPPAGIPILCRRANAGALALKILECNFPEPGSLVLSQAEILYSVFRFLCLFFRYVTKTHTDHQLKVPLSRSLLCFFTSEKSHPQPSRCRARRALVTVLLQEQSGSPVATPADDLHPPGARLELSWRLTPLEMSERSSRRSRDPACERPSARFRVRLSHRLISKHTPKYVNSP